MTKLEEKVRNTTTKSECLALYIHLEQMILAGDDPDEEEIQGLLKVISDKIINLDLLEAGYREIDGRWIKTE